MPKEMPWQELVHAVDGVITDVRQHMAQPSFGIDPVQLGSADQRVRAPDIQRNNGRDAGQTKASSQHRLYCLGHN